ncbi:MAG: type IX secretion system membrane protein PorP/SprF [Brumimicrobium sp.]|nr:type IX secretion system membrane protein PorP/SprF [Brumimicrobium sp.]
MNRLFRRISLATVIISCMTNGVSAQQEPQFTQYMDNLIYYNPGYAGSHDRMSIAALHRQQWAGFAGAPMSTTFALHSPLSYDNIGLGLSFVNDRLGPTNDTWINGDVSYSLKFKNHNGRLAFGVKAGVNMLNGDLTNLVKEDQEDATLNVRYKNEVKFNVGAGIFYHSDQFFVGVAVPRILENIKDIKDVTSVANEKFSLQRHYYAMIGGYINAGRMLKIRPNAMVKITENAPLAVDAGLAFIFYDKFWLGLNYRVLESAGLYLQYSFTPQFKMGYAFEFSTTKMGTHSAGTHEIMLAFDLLFKNKSLATPRYF